MNDQQAGVCLEAVLELALAIRDEGPEHVREAAQRVLDAAGGDPLAAVSIAAALVHIDESVDPWWQRGLEGIGNRCGTLAGYRAHNRAHDTPCQPCKDARAADEAQRRARNRAKAAA